MLKLIIAVSFKSSQWRNEVGNVTVIPSLDHAYLDLERFFSNDLMSWFK